ncbi:P-loop ATPase, Sll1717 family [Stenotrophomonas pavanii]|uniref:P-loop ATPase, Sll1717 family n=1 Tax=Stenotrophomonas pavanii TaxID=487698 RepID=UPI00383A93BC
MSNRQIYALGSGQVDIVRRRWLKDPSAFGFPNAERDSHQDGWYDSLLVQPDWFSRAIAPSATIAVARKGAGKSAVRIASSERRRTERNTLVIEASADELASFHSERLSKSLAGRYGTVSDWLQIYAELIVRELARTMGGSLLTGDDEIAVRAWARTKGITERDFGERIVDAIKVLVPWAQKLAGENAEQLKDSQDRIARVASASKFVLYVDDFDNLQEEGGATNIRLIRDSIEAADRITNGSKNGEVHLFMRQDLWLNVLPGWHYADKVEGVALLNWDVSDLKQWMNQRLRYAIAQALRVDPSDVRLPFEDMWHIFFAPEVRLKDGSKSDSFSYFVRRTMYTPRSLLSFIKAALEGAQRLPADQLAIEEAEFRYSTNQLEFMKTEFGSLCVGLDICLQSFTGKPLEWIASDLYKHLRGLIGNGQVKLQKGVSEGVDEVALSRFLYRIGFLEVRYPQDGRYEVRDVMRYPEHWRSIRTDDAVKWAVRSAFYNGLKSYGR